MIIAYQFYTFVHFCKLSTEELFHDDYAQCCDRGIKTSFSKLSNPEGVALNGTGSGAVCQRDIQTIYVVSATPLHRSLKTDQSEFYMIFSP